MTTQTDIMRPAKLFGLQQEVDILRSAVISVIGKDDEGDYAISIKYFVSCHG